VIGDMHVSASLRHDIAEALRRRCIGLGSPELLMTNTSMLIASYQKSSRR
jgi:hypothetical protein